MVAVIFTGVKCKEISLKLSIHFRKFPKCADLSSDKELFEELAV